MTDSEDGVTVVSYNRPLTRAARRDLKEYGIREREDPGEANRWTVLELETEPPEDVLDRHELRVEREPAAVYVTTHGKRVEVYADSVTVGGVEQSISPEDAREYADENGWDRVE